MKKKDCEKLAKMTYRDFSKLNEKKSYEMLSGMLPEGKRYKSAGMGDHDWWYLVKYMEVMEKDYKRYMCVIRSWNKYKQRWVYRCIGVPELLYCLHLDNEYDIYESAC